MKPKWTIVKSKPKGCNKGKKIISIGNLKTGLIEIGKIGNELQVSFVEYNDGGSENDYFDVDDFLTKKEMRELYGKHMEFKIPILKKSLIKELDNLNPFEEWGYMY